MSSNDNEYILFKELKNKIIKIDDKKLALSLLDDAISQSNNKIEHKLLNSLKIEHINEIKMDLDEFKNYLNIVDMIFYLDDAEKILSDLQKMMDKIQLNTLKRLIKNKPVKSTTYDKDHLTIKIQQCPHCKNKNIGYSNSFYVICGYSEKGFDWKGCGKDWCFRCEKKLCKNWNFDLLFNKLNRYHDGKCCKSNAIRIGDKYPDDYCQCQNENVNRNK